MLTCMERISKMSYLNMLKYGESNAMGSALNTWQMPQTVR